MRIAIGIFFIVILFPLISGIETEIKSKFDLGETLNLQLSGNFVEPISKQNIFLNRGHVRVAFEPELTKIEDIYYIYGSLLGKNSGNYTLIIENSKYYSGAELINQNIEIPFTISNETADFYILPGFIITNSTFRIKIQNLKTSSLTLGISTISESSKPISDKESNESFFSFFSSGESKETKILEDFQESIYLKSGEIQNLDFIAKGFKEPTLRFLKFTSEKNSYEIPIQVNQKDDSLDKEEFNLKFNPSELNISSPLNSESTKIIYLSNSGKNNLENIELSLSEELEEFIEISTREIEFLDSNSTIKLRFKINSAKEGIYYGQLKAKSKNNESIYDVAAITLNFLKDFIPSNETEEPIEENFSNGEEINNSVPPKENSGKLTGWIILIIVFVLIVWFFLKKYPSTRKKFDLMAATRRRK